MKRLIMVPLSAFALTACYDGNLREPSGGEKLSPDGIRYKIVIIEGRKFIATPPDINHLNWVLAGPIDEAAVAAQPRQEGGK